MALRLEMRLDTVGSTQQIQENPMGHAYELFDFYDRQPKIEATLKIGGEEHKLRYVLAPQSFLNYVHRGERFGAYLGDMVFINARLAEEHPAWVPFVLLKLYGEKHVDQGLDQSGRVKHMQSLYATIRVAGMIMNEEELRGFLDEIRNYETSGYFELDTEVREFLSSGGGNALVAKRKYLEAHRANKWVARGRGDELLNDLGFKVDGYRNHAEAIISAMPDLDLKNMYLATCFVHALVGAGQGMPTQIPKEYGPFAFAMTRLANDRTDLLFFEGTDPATREDIINLYAGKHRTLVALSKRLSYCLHIKEERVRVLADREKGRLDGLLVEAGIQNKAIANRIEEINTNALTKKSPFEETARILGELSANYAGQLASLGRVSADAARNLQSLERLSQTLVRQI